MKNIVIICCMLLCIFALGVVSAADGDDVISSDVDATFNQLEVEVNSTTQGGTLNLEKDYKWGDEGDLENKEGIVINKSITIDGKSHKIDANNKGRVFLVSADDVCLKNINFINANASSSGGSVFVRANNIQIINCNFTNSKSAATGAAITLMGNNITVSASNFEGGHVTQGNIMEIYPHLKPSANPSSGGGSGSGEVVVVNPSAPVYHEDLQYAFGGAIYIDGNVTVKDSSFKNNKAENDGGAIFVFNGSNILIDNSLFSANQVKRAAKNQVGYYYNDIYAKVSTTLSNSVYNNDYVLTGKITKNNSTLVAKFVEASNIEGSFGELKEKINAAGDLLVLDKDYRYVDGDDAGIDISKAITIDGRGHTLNGSSKSRIFNIAADNVTLININFINGFAHSAYSYNRPIGGGAIYWNGANAKLINCTFSKNKAIDSDSNSINYVYNESNNYELYTVGISDVTPVDPGNTGGTTNYAGAILLNGNNADFISCSFVENSVGIYPNPAGALLIKGDNITIDKCEFLNNLAYTSQSISYNGNNLLINSSLIYHSTSNVMDAEIGGSNIHRDNFVKVVYNKTADDNNLSKYQYIIDSNRSSEGNVSDYVSVMSDLFNLTLTAPGHHIVENLVENETNATTTSDVVTYSPKIINNKDLTIYYKSSTKYSVTVYGSDGKVAPNQYVTFTIDKKTTKIKTDKNGVASLKITSKPGKYTITAKYDGVTVKNKVTVKTTLITSDLSKKVKKTASFKVKVLKSNGKVYAKQTVKVKFNGKTYKIKTNSKGIATLKIGKNIKKGKYTIKTTYDGITNKNTLKVNK